MSLLCIELQEPLLSYIQPRQSATITCSSTSLSIVPTQRDLLSRTKFYFSSFLNFTFLVFQILLFQFFKFTFLVFQIFEAISVCRDRTQLTLHAFLPSTYFFKPCLATRMRTSLHTTSLLFYCIHYALLQLPGVLFLLFIG